jgi:hypothetical protein
MGPGFLPRGTGAPGGIVTWITEAHAFGNVESYVASLIADAVVRLVELDGLPAAVAGDSEAKPRRTTELVADLVEPAKAAALDKLDEGQRALGIATGWLRAKLRTVPTATTPSP